MFCRKCGVELPDGSAFCRTCGAEQQQFQGTAREGGEGANPFVICACIAAAVTAVFMLLPWLRIPVLSVLGQYGMSLGSAPYGGDQAYTLFGLRDLLDAFEQIIPSSGQYSNVGALWAAFMIGWAGTLIALVAGLVSARPQERNMKVLRGAGVAAMVVAVAWVIAVAVMNNAIADELNRYLYNYATVSITAFEAPIAVYLTALCGFATALLSHFSNE